MKPQTILIVDDDRTLLRTLRINLKASGYEPILARDGRTALAAHREEHPDLVILDLGLPDIDGVQVLKRIRAVDDVPIIVLSARRALDDKVEALDEGADDYVSKPFEMGEVMARIRVALRRTPASASSTTVVTPDFTLDFATFEATVSGRSVHLTPTEWRFLNVLAGHPGQVVSHSQLLNAVWGQAYARELNYLRVFMAHLRKKLEPDPAHPKHLLTDPGIGYRLT